MTLNEVNEQYQQIFNVPNSTYEPVFTWLFLLVLVGVVALLVLLQIWRHHLNNKKDRRPLPWNEIRKFAWAGLLIAGCISSVVSIVLSFIRLDAYDTARRQEVAQAQAQIEQWRSEVALPFLKTLPLHKQPLIYLKIDPEIETTVSGDFSFGTGTIESESQLLTPMVMSYKDNGKIVTHTERLPSEMDLAATDQPYVSYRTLPQPLGVVDIDQRRKKLCYGLFCSVNSRTTAEYEARNFDYTVHLPSNYTFTEIK